MVTELGTELGTTLGTNLGSMEVYGTPVFDVTKLYGVANLSAANYLQTQAGGGEAGVATGFGVIELRYLASIPPAVGVTARRLTPSTAGWQHYVSGTAHVSNYSNATSLVAVSSGLTASDAQKMHVHVSRVTATPGVLEQAIDTVWNASTPAMSAYGVPGGTTYERWGLDETGANPATTTAVAGGLRFRGVPTRAQLDALVMLCRTLGDVPSKAAAEALMPIRYGITGFTTANYLQTPAGAGIPGSTGGFYIQFGVRYDAVPPANQMLMHATNAGATRGWFIQSQTTLLRLVVLSPSAANSVVGYTITTADVGRLRHVLVHYTSTGALRIYVDGVQIGADVAGAGFEAAASVPMQIGMWTTTAFTSGALFGVSGGAANPTAAEVAQAASAFLSTHQLTAIPGKTDHTWRFHDDIAANGGGIPATFLDRTGTDNLSTVGTPTVASYGATVTHRWSLRDTLAAANVPVADGAAAPASIPDSVTGASVDAMGKVGSPVVRVLDPATPKLWSYETTPILYGSTDHSASNYYEAATGAAGNATAFGGTLVWRPRAGATSATRALLSAQAVSPTRGFDIRTGGANATVSMIFLSAANAGTASGSGTIAASALDRIHVFSFQWDGANSRLRVYLDRLEVGTGVPIAGYAVPPGKLTWGSQQNGANPAPFNDLYGFRMWDGVASLAQIQAQHDAILAADGRIQPMPGLTNTFEVDVTADCLANGGVLPATLLERIGGNNLARTGSPSAAPQYARAFAF